MIRRIAACLLFAALVASGVRPAMLRLLVPPHVPEQYPPPGGALDRWPLRWRARFTSDAFERFLEDARVQTRPGDTLALQFVAPYDGFGYAHWRASYALTGRYVLPPRDIRPWPREPDAWLFWNGIHGSVERVRP
ncbi:MAG TPA: hypothetical protein VM733_22250 [Thermoanaerobaculia bacterium]|nr:hypothetical protein [Thermoanaerobaculia bacterium]